LIVIATVVFFGPDRGGRHSPPVCGYRPQLDLGDVQTSCIIDGGQGDEGYNFDVEYIVSLTLMFPAQYGERVRPGDRFALREGARQVGTATIA
jgi:translation elongation factor EF-Tu-like GTPase